MRILCPHCKTHCEVPDTCAGREVRCPACQQLFTVPMPASRPFPYSPAAMTPAAASAAAPRSPAMTPSGPEPGGRFAAPGDGAGHAPAQTPHSDLPGTADGTANQPATAPKRPLPVVWIVFYWLIGGLARVALGLIVIFAASMAGRMANMVGAPDGAKELSQLAGAGVLVSLLMEFLGLLLFHFGLLTLVTCHGLWTNRHWGLQLAKGVALAFTVLTALGFIATIVTRTGILTTLANLAISIGIVIYLFGRSQLADRLRQYQDRLPRLEDRQWDG